MLVFLGAAGLRPEWDGSVVCIGTFDGVHLGHQKVVSTAVEEARRRSLPSVVVTFDRHPASVLAPERCPPCLATVSSNLRRFEALGASVAVVLPFDRNLAERSAGQFFEEVLVGSVRAEAMVVGHDFAFGKGREGTPAWLSERIATTVVPPLQQGGCRVSSSAIRRLVAEGILERASELLGRPYCLEGVVVAGERLGRRLGYPTANLGLACDQVVPADGVYAGRCRTPFGEFAAAVSIGTRPTVGGGRRAIEAHLLDYPGRELYGSAVELDVLSRIRGQETFDGVEALKRQMALDVQKVRRMVG